MTYYYSLNYPTVYKIVKGKFNILGKTHLLFCLYGKYEATSIKTENRGKR